MVSNELVAGHPRTAKFSVAVVVISSLIIGLILSLILIITRDQDFIAQFQGANMVSISYCLKDLFCYVNGIFVDG